MTATLWQAQRLASSHVVLSVTELQDVHREFGSDPKQVVKPAARPSGFMYVDPYGFDMRSGDSLLQKGSKSLPLRSVSSPGQDVVKTEKGDKGTQPASFREENNDIKVKPSEKKPLPKGWKVRKLVICEESVCGRPFDGARVHVRCS